MTCFTGTNVQMLTRRKALQARRERAERRALREGKSKSRASARDANTDKENLVRAYASASTPTLRSACTSHRH